MISLKYNSTALYNLNKTLEALSTMDAMIKTYSENKQSPAYTFFRNGEIKSEVQFDRDIVVQALQDQRQRLVEYLASLGIDANN